MAQINQADDPRLVAMRLLMDEAGRAASFHELDPFGERHGSWQRTIHAWSAPDGLDRYVIAAVTSLDDGEEIAVMAGAEERSVADTGRPRFRRFDVGSIRLNGDSFNLWPIADIKELLAQAVRMAVEIQPDSSKKCNCWRAELRLDIQHQVLHGCAPRPSATA